MVNNSAKIVTMLSFVDRDDFYFGQIFKRRKDNPDLGRDQIVIDNFYINSLDDLIKKLPNIIRLCDVENARAYLRINKRNYKSLGPHLLKRVVDIVFTDNCASLRNAFDSVAGEFHADPDKKWVIDIDWSDFGDAPVFIPDMYGDLKLLTTNASYEFTNLFALLEKLQNEADRVPMMEILPTKNGVHLITRPFSLLTFREEFPKVMVHKDNPTLLYCP